MKGFDRRALIGRGLLLGASALLPAARAPSARPRILVSTDIGGTDPDDFQSMVHLLVTADSFDLEGLISSPFGAGRREHILQVIEHYARDYAALRSWSARYPTPARLTAIARQGAIDGAGFRGVDTATDGSDWIVRCARRADDRPLHVLVWGGIEDLAQALYDAPDIESKLRVYFIGGPNKKWSPNAYAYLAAHHPKLWIIEANATYRGWFVGGDQTDAWGNTGFVERHVAGKGSLGDFFATQLSGTIKMGDSPSVSWARGSNPGDPRRPGWGGSYVRAWSRAPRILTRPTTAADEVEVFSIVELVIPAPLGAQADAVLRFDNLTFPGVREGSAFRFRCSPKEAKRYEYRIESAHPSLTATGSFTAIALSPSRATPDRRWPNWWTDDPAPITAEGPHAGARTVNRWRHEFLGEFAGRMARCAAPATASARLSQE